MKNRDASFFSGGVSKSTICLLGADTQHKQKRSPGPSPGPSPAAYLPKKRHTYTMSTMSGYTTSVVSFPFHPLTIYRHPQPTKMIRFHGMEVESPMRTRQQVETAAGDSEEKKKHARKKVLGSCSERKLAHLGGQAPRGPTNAGHRQKKRAGS